MSAESSEAKPSIDDILSSIRQMIADESTGEDSPDPADDHASETNATATNGTRSQAVTEESPEPVEDVLDLSEEFIVTEATAAVRREQERGEQPEPQAAAAEAADPAVDESDAAEQDDSADIAAAEVWNQDFQMPVGEEGPASPFAAASTPAENSWAGSESFDVTELYSRARSFSPPPRAEPSAAPEDETAAVGARATVTPDETDEMEHDSEAEAPEEGIELTSLSELHRDAPVSDETASSDPDDNTQMDKGDAMPAEEPLNRLHAAEEIEAVFGMPPRGWGTSQQAQAQPEARIPDAAETGTRGEHEDADDLDAEPHVPDPDYPVGHGRLDEPPGAAPHAPPADPEASAAAAFGAATAAKSLEESVKELLRPMLVEWLDKNMPRLVEAAMREQMDAGRENQRPADETADEGAAPPTDRRYGSDV